jgi:hypothetical protein
MADKASYAETTQDWESLLNACAENGTSLSNLQGLIAPLTDLLPVARRWKAVQEQAEGTRQEATQKIQEALAQGREAARRLRSVVRGQLGSKSERLPQFGVAPLRSRPRKTAVKPPQSGAEPAAPEQ